MSNPVAGADILAADLNLIVPIGVPLPFFGSAAYLPDDHLLLDGTTIGDAASGGTARANADTVTLFTLLWNSIADAELIIQNSAGAPCGRGANAAADYAAHKRLPLPDMRENVPVGYKSGSTEFGTLGKKYGEKTHTLTVPEMPAHTHTLNYSQGSLGSSGAPTAVIAGSTNSGSTGGDGAHNNVQPSFAVNWITRYKSYA